MFSRSISTDIVIAAPARDVWDVLTRFTAYGEWNPFIREAAGRAVPGERLRLGMSPSGGKLFRIEPVIVAADKERELRWQGRVGLPFLFDAEHRFRLTPQPSGGTRFEQSETFFGLLVPFVSSMLAETEQAFKAMNEALKRRCEDRSR